jgi:hypothetical protein
MEPPSLAEALDQLQAALAQVCAALQAPAAVPTAPQAPRDTPPLGPTPFRLLAELNPRTLLTVRDLAAVLQVSPEEIRRWMDRGDLPPAVPLGKWHVVQVRTVEDHLTRRDRTGMP